MIINTGVNTPERQGQPVIKGPMEEVSLDLAFVERQREGKTKGFGEESVHESVAKHGLN